MIIECPSCGARAKLPDSKEGAKVRCSECQRVYVARGSGRAATRTAQNNTALPIGIGAGVLALVAVFMMSRGGDEESGVPDLPEVVAEAPVEEVDDTGWDSPLVKRARDLHDLAYASEEFNLQSAIDWPHVWARLQLDPEAPDAELFLAGYETLNNQQVDDLRASVLGALQAKEAINLVGTWKPFDGHVVSESDTDAVLRLAIEPRGEEGSTGTRNIEWKFVKQGSQWKAWSWERWQSPEELKSQRVARKKSYARKTLSDGSQVIEAEPGPIAYMDETSETQRKQIDALIANLLDPNLPAKQLTRTRGELELAGKHAIPPLLTKFYELNEAGFPDMESAIQAQMVHSMLSDLTGYVTTFSAHEALGATQERRDSGVRQWFGWYTRKFKRFEGRVDRMEPLEEEPEFASERERREYEKNKRIMAEQEATKNLRKRN